MMTLIPDDNFGLCPTCHKTDGCANVGKSHVFYCQEHKTCWWGGSNIFSSWRDQTKEEQRRIWNEIGLDEFSDVEPYFYPRDEAGNVLDEAGNVVANDRQAGGGSDDEIAPF